MDYLQWNDLIAAKFFCKSNVGQDVHLAVTEETINELGSEFHADFQDLVRSAKIGPPWIRQKVGFCRKAKLTFINWRERKLPYPPYIGYLAIFVIASGFGKLRKTAFGPLAFYGPLREILGEKQRRGMYPSYGQIIELWDDLERWSKEDCNGSLGVFRCDIDGNWIHVGLAKAQFLVALKDYRLTWEQLQSKSNYISTLATTSDGMPVKQFISRPLSKISSRSLPIAVRAVMRVGGRCDISFLLRKQPHLPASITLVDAKDTRLGAIHESWYGDLVTEELSTQLKKGAMLRAADCSFNDISWSLRGKFLHVLGVTEGLSGYVSCNQIFYGKEYMLLVADEILARVETQIAKLGLKVRSTYGESDGLPDGWTLFVGLKIEQTTLDDLDILEVLRPSIEISIELSNGLNIKGNTWLSGFPPSIRIYGHEETRRIATIDGITGEWSNGGFLSTQGYDSVGKHTIRCGTRSRTYSIIDIVENDEWPIWEAHLSLHPNKKHTFAICGASIWKARKESALVPVQLSHPPNIVLIGSKPGQVNELVSSPLDPKRSLSAYAFIPIWRLPKDPIHCDKSSNHIIFEGELLPPSRLNRTHELNVESKLSILRWSKLILDACRKGLSPITSEQYVSDLWKQYRSEARRCRRLLRNVRK